MAERKTFLLRLDEEDLEAMRRWADDEFRSLNGQIEYLLRQALMQHRSFKPRGKSRSGGPQSGGVG